MSTPIALVGLIGFFVAWWGVKNEKKPLTFLGSITGLLCIVLVLVQFLTTEKPTEQSIDYQWELLKDAIPGWKAENLLIVHHPEQALAANELGKAHSQTTLHEVPDPYNLPDIPIEELEYRIRANDFQSLVSTHADADLLLLMTGLPGGIRQAQLTKTQRLVIADLSSDQWQLYSRHPNIIAGLIPGEEGEAGWKLVKKEAR